MSHTSAAIRKPECMSMTGYAQARAETTDLALRVSVKSVNHRFLDLKLRMPEGLEQYEPRLRQVVRERIHRGHVEIQVAAEPRTAATIQVNQELVKAYLRAAETLRQETRAAADVDVVALLRLPGVISGLGVAAPQSEESQEQLGRALEDCLRDALGKLDDMRRAEGAHLIEELRARLTKIEAEADQVRVLAETLRPAFAKRLDARLKELLSGASLEPARLAQEAAILAERFLLRSTFDEYVLLCSSTRLPPISIPSGARRCSPGSKAAARCG